MYTIALDEMNGRHTHTHTHLQERARVLRLALKQEHLQKLVKMGSLHPAAHMTRCGALTPLGGPAVCGLNRRPYFTCRQKMIGNIRALTQ